MKYRFRPTISTCRVSGTLPPAWWPDEIKHLYVGPQWHEFLCPKPPNLTDAQMREAFWVAWNYAPYGTLGENDGVHGGPDIVRGAVTEDRAEALVLKAYEEREKNRAGV